jgi:uncharacterized delta-60 repeat protein
LLVGVLRGMLPGVALAKEASVDTTLITQQLRMQNETGAVNSLANDAAGSPMISAVSNIGVNDITSRVQTTHLDASQATLLTANDDTSTFMVVSGGVDYDYGNSMQVTSDGGYIVAGRTESYDVDRGDVFLIKYDSSGEISWAKTAGGSEWDSAASVDQTADDGYIVAGFTKSFGEGGSDVFLLKYDSSGTLSWAKTIGGSGDDSGTAVEQTSDDGYIVSAYTTSYGAGGRDILLLKYDSSGVLSWARTAGGPNDEFSSDVQQTTPDNGYIVAGNTESYGAGETDVFLLKYDTNGTLNWARTAGGLLSDSAYAVKQTADNGYIVAGYTGYDETGGLEEYDALLLKYDSSGTLTWAKTAGKQGWDSARSVEQTSDGGYILAGSTGFDAHVLLVKYNSSGVLTWSTMIKEPDFHSASAVEQTADGGYILSGYITSFGSGRASVLLMKTNAQGLIPFCDSCGTVSLTTASPTLLLSSPTALLSSPVVVEGTPVVLTSSPSPDRALPCGLLFLTAAGGSASDGADSVQSTSDGGYIVTGHTESYGAGGRDIFLLKYDSTGELDWARTAGGEDWDWARSVEQTSDGGYILAGETESYDAGVRDVFLVKYDKSGSLVWARTAGGSSFDSAASVAQTTDDGYIVAGSTSSFGAGSFDVFLLKYDSGGVLTWAKTAGGSGSDSAYSVEQTSDFGYIVAGFTSSYGIGNNDVFLLKYDVSGVLTWARTTGGSDADYARSVAQTGDGGYIVAGFTKSYGAGGYDVFLIEYDSTGTLNWASTAGGSADDQGYSVVHHIDGGYVVAGYTTSYGAGGKDVFLLRFHRLGSLGAATTIGGSGTDRAYSLVRGMGSGLILAGDTHFGAGIRDILVVKTNRDGLIPDCDACAKASPTAAKVFPGVTAPTVSTSTHTVTKSSPTPTSAPLIPGRDLICGGILHTVFLPLVIR